MKIVAKINTKKLDSNEMRLLLKKLIDDIKKVTIKIDPKNILRITTHAITI